MGFICRLLALKVSLGSRWTGMDAPGRRETSSVSLQRRRALNARRDRTRVAAAAAAAAAAGAALTDHTL
jgi:hypothetical protein